MNEKIGTKIIKKKMELEEKLILTCMTCKNKGENKARGTQEKKKHAQQKKQKKKIFFLERWKSPSRYFLAAGEDCRRLRVLQFYTRREYHPRPAQMMINARIRPMMRATASAPSNAATPFFLQPRNCSLGMLPSPKNATVPVLCESIARVATTVETPTRPFASCCCISSLNDRKRDLLCNVEFRSLSL